MQGTYGILKQTLTIAQERKNSPMKLLIVDDDRYAREGILSILPLEQLGIQSVMQTHDGRTALEIVRWFCPDVIITDICMPRMNGMEFASAVRSIQPECLIIFITGFAEIDYLKQAIELSAVAFVEKPLEQSELIKAVENAAHKYQERMSTNQRTESLLKLNRQQLAALLTRRDKDMAETQALCQKVGYPVTGEYQCLAVTTRQQNLLDMIATLEKACRGYGFHAVTELKENRQLHMVLAFTRQAAKERKRLLDELMRLCPDIRIGEGMEVGGLERVAESRRAACAMLEGAFYRPGDRLFGYHRYEQQPSVLTMEVYARFSRLLDEDMTGLQIWLEAVLRDIASAGTERVANVRNLMQSIAKELFSRYPDLAGRVYGISQPSELEEYILSVSDIAQYQAFVGELFAQLDALNAASSRYAQVVRDAKSYIAKTFDQPELALDQIAAQVSFSPAYLNVIFRTETGMTVKQYLIACRIREAKRLLRDPKVRISEIAERCGYSNSNYFAKAFKDMTGLTPGEYREQRA